MSGTRLSRVCWECWALEREVLYTATLNLEAHTDAQVSWVVDPGFVQNYIFLDGFQSSTNCKTSSHFLSLFWLPQYLEN